MGYAKDQKPRLGFWQIWNMSFGFLGIQFGWGLQMANMSAIYRYLGADEATIPLLWLAGPVTGVLIQPVVGAWSDRTWTRLGCRRPFFLAGALVASGALVAMPSCSALWMAAGLLWILDASINVTMEPFRAFVADKLPEEQRPLGFVSQSFFIGVGQTLANGLPWVLGALGLAGGTMASGIPVSVQWSFVAGGVTFLLAVLWTVVSTDEYPPEDLAAFRRMQAERAGFVAGLAEVVHAVRDMPRTMRQLALVQFFTWFALPCMWQYFGLAVARHVFGAVDPASPRFTEGIAWAGLCFAAYNVVCFGAAFLLPPLAVRYGRTGVHSLALVAGALGLLSVARATGPWFLFGSMAGVGVAWASILSMPYVILAGAIPAERMGVYMGVFNLCIVAPQVVMSLAMPWVYGSVLGGDPLAVVLLGGASLLVAAAVTLGVDDRGRQRTSSASAST